VAVLSANIQVLRGMKLFCSDQPVALGTIVFATTYLCSGILTEHYGQRIATKNIVFGACGQLLMTLLMIIAIGHKPLSINFDPQSLVAGTEHMLHAEQAMNILFLPSPRFLFSSLVSFMLSQLVGIVLFEYINKLTNHKFLWLRTILLLIISMVLDNLIFNFLAWKLLANNPSSWRVIFHTYILWTLITQIGVTLLSSPIIYMSYLVKKPQALAF
jgi:queuosine precursor transporter